MNIKDNELNILLNLAANKCLDDDLNYFNSIDVSGIHISKKAERKVKRIIHLVETKVKRFRNLNIFRRIAAVFLIVCTITFVGAMSIEAIRIELWNAVVTWYDNYISIYFDKTNIPQSDIPTMIETAIKPAYIPIGWEMQLLNENNTVITYEIFNRSGGSVLFQQMVYNENDIWIDNKDADVEEIIVNGVTAYLCSYPDGSINLTWSETYLFIFSSEGIDRESLLMIARSLN